MNLQLSPALIILDLSLPKVDGFELLRELLSLEPRPAAKESSEAEPDSAKAPAETVEHRYHEEPRNIAFSFEGPFAGLSLL